MQEFRKLSFDEKCVERIKEMAKKEDVERLQVVVYTMCGGGWLGRSAAEQPAEFYIDTRCGRLPYPKRAIMQAVQVLVLEAGFAGLDPKNLPPMGRFHCCGVF